MVTLRQEVKDVIRASEVIQAMIAQGSTLTPDEVGVLELCTHELLKALKAVKSCDG
jgi:hypothetical protein